MTKKYYCSKDYDVVNNDSDYGKWYDTRLYMPTPSYVQKYPCIVKEEKTRLRKIKYIDFIPEHPYNIGYWDTNDEILWFMRIKFPNLEIDTVSLN